jgi:PAS domain S-box-containing protein
MKSVKKESAKREMTPEEKIEWISFWTFFVSTVLLWFFSEQVAIVFLYIPGVEIKDVALFERARIILSTFLTLTTALVLYAFVMSYKLKQKPKPTVSKETVTDLMLSREQFRKLYENSPVPYFLMDDKGNIRNPNRATLRFFGGTLETCSSSNFYSLIESSDEEKGDIALFRTKIERSIPVSQEEMSIFNLKKDKVRYALVSVYSLEKKSTIPFKHLVTLVDVTKEKESERVKTDFLLLASHQLRTPLTTVKWYIDYLLTTNNAEMSDVVREYLEQIYIGNERMIELITTLLTVSRIEMGTLAPDYKTIKINEVVDDILEELAQDIKKKNTKIEVKSEGNDSLVMDYTMIRIVIHNLLTNAIKYTPSGGKVLVNLNFQPHSCEISVSDTGYGIPKEEQDKIFTKMFRASNARKVSTNGTGLGLYLSKAFVEKLGGAIDFTSEEGKGTTFTISLPRVAPGA